MGCNCHADHDISSRRIGLLIAFVFVAFESSADEGPGAEPARKSARTAIGGRELAKFVSHELSRPSSRGSLVDVVGDFRTVHGRVLDHDGKPVTGALVAICERIGYSNQCYDENFDMTDDLGRFVVQAAVDKNRLVIRRGPTAIWRFALQPTQDYAVVQWPAPSSCKITVDKSLGAPGDTLTIATSRYWAGMSVMRYGAVLDQDRSATVSDLIPTSYFITNHKTAKVGENEESVPVEIGSFSVKPGETANVKCVHVGQRGLKGRVTAPVKPLSISIERQKSRYEDWPRIVDFVGCEADGSFATRPLEPGNYVLTVLGPAPAELRGLGFGGPRRYTIRKRITVPKENLPIEVTFGGKIEGTAAAVRSILDTRSTGRWSVGRQVVTNRIGHADRKGVEAELIRIINDRHAPFEWQDSAMKALGGMTESPRALNALLTKLKSAKGVRLKTRAIRAFDQAKQGVDQIVPALLPFIRDPEFRVRWAAYSALTKLALIDGADRTAIEVALSEMLDDPWERTRADVAAALGRLEARSALPALKKARQDRSGKVRVWAAWAIWKITGDQEQAIKLMTARLYKESSVGKWEAAYLLSDLKNLPPLTIKGLQALAEMEHDRQDYEQQRIKQVANSTLKKVGGDRRLD